MSDDGWKRWRERQTRVDGMAKGHVRHYGVCFIVYTIVGYDIDRSPVANTWGFLCSRHNGWRPVVRPLSYCVVIGWNVMNGTMSLNGNDLVVRWISWALRARPIDGRTTPAACAPVSCPAIPSYCKRSCLWRRSTVRASTVTPLDLCGGCCGQDKLPLERRRRTIESNCRHRMRRPNNNDPKLN